jgi:hypothetical protein
MGLKCTLKLDILWSIASSAESTASCWSLVGEDVAYVSLAAALKEGRGGQVRWMDYQDKVGGDY